MLIWIENLSGSFIWQQREWQDIVNSGTLKFLVTDYCRWGTSWRKRTRFCNNIPGLVDEKLLCNCAVKKHRRLVGFSKAHGKSWTKVAEPYPGRRCSALAAFVVEGLKPPNADNVWIWQRVHTATQGSARLVPATGNLGRRTLTIWKMCNG